MDKYECGFLDLRFKIKELFCKKNINNNIVIIDIDETTLNEELGQWPFPRTFYGEIIKTLTEDGAKVICIDILLSEPDRLDEKNDFLLSKTMEQTKNVILPVEFFIERKAIDQFNPSRGFISIEKLIFPLGILKNQARGLGFTNLSPDKDGIYRECKLTKKYNGKTYNSFSLEIVNTILNTTAEKEKNSIALKGKNKKNIPLNHKDKMFINYQGSYKTFKYISFKEVYNKNHRKKNPDFFKDKYVIIGSSAPGLADLKATPFTPAMPGVEIQANILNTILEENYIVQSSPTLDISLIFILSITGLIFIKFKPVWSIILAVSFMVTILIISIILFNYYNFLLTTVPILGTTGLTYISIISFRLINSERRKKKLRNIFQKYVSNQIVNSILKDLDNTSLALGGKRSKLTISFTDIRGFTPMSEKLTPEEVVNMLNEYFTSMTEIIFHHDGTIDKFMGDCIMSFWGAPLPHKDDALRAVKTALEMREALQKLTKKWEIEGKLPIAMGTGINTGEVVVGNIGSPERMEYTVIGDNVNLAQRLESNAAKGQILISEATYKEIKNNVVANALPPIKVKGKSKPITVYEVMGMK